MDSNWLIGIAAICTMVLNIVHTRLLVARTERDAREKHIRYEEHAKARVDALEKEVDSLKLDRREMFKSLENINTTMAGFSSTLKHIAESLQILQKQIT